MDLIDKLRELSNKIPKLREQGLIKTEEGTKNALIMPFINALGYNVFDPLEVTPELVADVGTKKGEKVDYAILQDGKPIILFECKSFGTDLRLAHASQLFRYFSVTPARFGILTDGVQYHIFSDLDEPNKMDPVPFFIFNLTDFNDAGVEELKRFSKSMFDQQKIITSASELKYRNAIKQFLEAQFNDKPTEAFIRLCLQESKAYTGRFTQTVLDQFTPITAQALRQFITDQVDKRLKSALSSQTESASIQDTTPSPEIQVIPAPTGDKTAEEAVIITTQEEIDGYNVVKAIVRDVIDVRRVVMRDNQSYCGILIDDNNRKPLARLRFNYTQKYIEVMDAQKNGQKMPITSVDDIFNYADQLRATAASYTGN